MADILPDVFADGRFRMLYDGACPLCRREVLALRRRRPAAIEAVDITAPDFDAAAPELGLGPEVDYARLQAALYGIRPDGSVTVGMDTLREGYRRAGIGWVLGWTGWWPARPVFDAGYRQFARNRMRISRWLGRQADDCGERCGF